MKNIEEKVEEQYEGLLDSLGIRHYDKTEKINKSIDDALKNADYKSGGSGNNYPDIQFIVNNTIGRYVPVMIEAKGSKGKLEKLAKDNSIVGITYYESDGKPNKDVVS